MRPSPSDRSPPSPRPAPRAALAVATALALALSGGAAALAQEDDEEPGGVVPVDPARFGRRAAGETENRIHIRESRELEVRCREAEAAEGRGDFARAARSYLDVLRAQRDPDAGVQGVVRIGERRWLSFARYARDRLLAFPEEGRKAFRAVADVEARALFDAAAGAGDLRGLESVWRTYPLASCADEALERLGDAAWEAGDAAVALDRWQLAAGLAGGDLDPKRLAAKVAAARRRVEAAASAPPPPLVPRWTVAGGDAAHCAPLPALHGIDAAARASMPMPPSEAGRSWGQRARRMPRFDGLPIGRDEVSVAETVPAVDRGRLVLANGNAISCFDLASGDRRWYQGVWVDRDRRPNVFYGATIAGGRVFSSFTKRVSKADFYRGIPIVEEIPYRRLVAFSLETGKRLWDQSESPDAFLSHPMVSIGLPPVERGGVLFAGATIYEAQFKCYVVALDAASGRLLWRRFIAGGQVELTMFGEPAIEPLHMQAAEKDGVVYCCTAFGAVAALEARTGEIQWISTYDSIPIEAARTYYAQERSFPWRNCPPVVSDGALVVAPIDSERAFAFDAASGELRWSIEAMGLRRLVGAWAGRAVFHGERAHTIDIRTGKLAAAYPRGRDAPSLGDEETGQGLIAGGVLVIPHPTRLVRIDVMTAERLPEIPLAGGIRQSGTLLYVGRDLVTVNPLQASVFRAYGPALDGAAATPVAPAVPAATAPAGEAARPPEGVR